MFKKLRNKLLITNMIIITALVIGCLSAIYITTYTSIKSDIDERLSRTINMYSTALSRPAMRPEIPGNIPKKDIAPPHHNSDLSRAQKPDENMRADAFSTEISVYCNKSGDIISSQSVFSLEDANYTNTIRLIAVSAKNSGTTTLDVDSWAYKKVEYDDGYIIAFTKNVAERKMLFSLMIILSVAAVISIGISFLISRFSANHAIQPIEEAYNKQKQFVADASHELRTPLASINANADVLLSRDCCTEEKKWLIYIKEEATRLTNLTNDLLMLASSDTNNKKTALSEVTFSDIAEDIVLESEAIAFEHGIKIKADIEKNITVHATDAGIKQIAMILLDNAIKYSDRGTETTVSLKADNGKIIFAVKNDGNIEKADLPHVFERFYRADKSRSSEGYGLGLAIARELCRSFNAKITAESKNDKVTFSVVF